MTFTNACLPATSIARSSKGETVTSERIRSASSPPATQADIVIRPNTRGVGLLEFHQIDHPEHAAE
jgi:hypothetical protein